MFVLVREACQESVGAATASFLSTIPVKPIQANRTDTPHALQRLPRLARCVMLVARAPVDTLRNSEKASNPFGFDELGST